MKILIADDHRLVTEAVKTKLSEIEEGIEFCVAMSVDELMRTVSDDVDLAVAECDPAILCQALLLRHAPEQDSTDDCSLPRPTPKVLPIHIRLNTTCEAANNCPYYYWNKPEIPIRVDIG